MKRIKKLLTLYFIGCVSTFGYVNATSLIEHITNPTISPAQQYAVKFIEKYMDKDRENLEDLISVLEKVSTSRYPEDHFFFKPTPTELERYLDNAVKNGDLPITPFTLREIQEEKSQIDQTNQSLHKAKFILPNLDKNGRGIDALKLYKFAHNESIVQLASQFEALESPTKCHNSVINWPYDFTQGPKAALQSISASKHREAACLQGKLPDAIKELLDSCIVQDYKGNNVPITKKYPDLYKNGYLMLEEINDNKMPKTNKLINGINKIFFQSYKKSAVFDMSKLKKHIKENIGNLKFLSQWVKCENTDQTQLQAFSAAPNCANLCFDNKRNKTSNLTTEICKIIVSEQYKAIAQVAAIRAAKTGNHQSLHLTLVGQEVFHNPPEVVKEAIKLVYEEVKDYDVSVYIHAFNQSKYDFIRSICKELNIDLIF